MNAPRRDQFSGCLIGQCLGDALGFPAEGFPPAYCRRYVERILRTGVADRHGRDPFPFGQYTDDSQLARELMQSYVEKGGFNAEDYAARIAAIFREGRIVGRGLATDHAARRLNEGVPWCEAGEPPPSAGNGSAMRAAPVGLFFFDQPDELIRVAHDQSRITHKDRRCSAGAVAIAGAVGLALQSPGIDTEEFLMQLSQRARVMDESVGDGLKQLIEWAGMPPGEAVEFISRAGLAPVYSNGWQGISPFVTTSVLWSLYSFLRSPEDYWETICTAIAVGGDVDTTAAMAGAISGAHLRLDAIPSQLADRLTDRGTWGYAELISLADRCYDLKMQEMIT